MAKYLLVEVDDDRKALALTKKLAGVEGVTVVGRFSMATQLCECEPHTYQRTIGNALVTVRGAKKGWMICPACARPRNGNSQILWNEMDAAELPTKFREIHIGVRWVRDLAGKVRTKISPKEW